VLAGALANPVVAADRSLVHGPRGVVPQPPLDRSADPAPRSLAAAAEVIGAARGEDRRPPPLCDQASGRRLRSPPCDPLKSRLRALSIPRLPLPDAAVARPGSDVRNSRGSPMPKMQLPDNEVHVWEASLDRPREVVQGFRTLLTAGERERADRFRFERDRDRYVVGRGQLRSLLAAYQGVRPTELRFEYGEFEKPALAGADLHFNLAHSGDVVLFAFTRAGEVGVDVELEATRPRDERLAERFFSPAEVATFRSLPRSERPRAFLRCWTRKEAFLKARGDGLQLALDTFDVSLAPGQPVAVMRTEWSRTEPTEWSLSDLSDERAGYIAAIAIRTAAPPVIQRRTLTPSDEQTLMRQEE
jgi:4'-phosphopantetheinyl transferase